MKPVVPALTTLLAIAALANGEARAENVPARPAAFAPCAACHTVQPGQKSFGPNLHGVVGRKAASLPGYAYSNALKAANLTWNRQALDRWLTAPQKAVPGTKMPFPGIADPAKRQQIIEYLQKLR